MTFNCYTSLATRRYASMARIEYIIRVALCLIVIVAVLLLAGHGEQIYFEDLGVIEIK